MILKVSIVLHHEDSASVGPTLDTNLHFCQSATWNHSRDVTNHRATTFHLSGVPVYLEFLFLAVFRGFATTRYELLCMSVKLTFFSTMVIFFWVIRNFESLCLLESACFSKHDGWCRENSYNYYLVLKSVQTHQAFSNMFFLCKCRDTCCFMWHPSVLMVLKALMASTNHFNIFPQLYLIKCYYPIGKCIYLYL